MFGVNESETFIIYSEDNCRADNWRLLEQENYIGNFGIESNSQVHGWTYKDTMNFTHETLIPFVRLQIPMFFFHSFFLSCMQIIVIWLDEYPCFSAYWMYVSLTIQHTMNKSLNKLDIKSLKTHWINYALIWLHLIVI